jgi:hypothetical protein
VAEAVVKVRVTDALEMSELLVAVQDVLDRKFKKAPVNEWLVPDEVMERLEGLYQALAAQITDVGGEE